LGIWKAGDDRVEVAVAAAARKGWLMVDYVDKVSSGASKVAEGAGTVAKGAEKVFRQGIDRVEEYQITRQMNGVARRLGYAEFEAYRSQQVDVEARKALIQEMFSLEEQLEQMRVVRAEAPTEADEGSATGAASEQAPSGAEPSQAAPQQEDAPETAGE
jgi:X-X-X-Leu-X-X-Gly heptad repeat protein